MSRLSYSDSFSSKKSIQECTEAAQEALSTLGCKAITEQNGTEFTGKLGMGLVIRLIGGLIAPSKYFPVILSVGIKEEGEGHKITVRIDENFGFGVLAGIKEKIQSYCDELGTELRQLLESRLG